jgi:4-amino-4-deoxy-L-arabinose transferase-like glycosyltransferase
LALRLIVVSLAFRDVAAPTFDHEQFGQEMGWIARSIASRHGFASPFLPQTGPTALEPPLYPYLLAAVFRVFGIYTATSALVILFINSLCSALTCIPIYYSASSAINQRIATLATWAWAVYPFAIYFSADRVWDYALTGMLFTTCFWASQHLHSQRRIFAWLGFGILYGITSLSNPATMTLFPVFLILVAVACRRLKRKCLGRLLVAVLGFIVVLTPWTVRNYRVFHILIPMRDNFWLESWAGNNGNTFESNDRTARPPSSAVELQKFEAKGEKAFLAHSRTLAMNYIRLHPFLFIKSTLHRIVCYWTGYWSFDAIYLHDEPTEIPNIFFCTLLTFFMLIGMKRLWRRNKAACLPYLCVIAIFPLSYYVTHVKPDFRQAIEPEIVVLTILGMFGGKSTDFIESADRQETQIYAAG